MKFTSYIYTLLGVLCLYACSDEDNNGVASSDSNGVVFSANIGEYQTRIATDGGSWAKGDRIGTYMYAAGTENLMTFSIMFRTPARMRSNLPPLKPINL